MDMISVTRLNDRELIINCELIECVEKTPDTSITMTTGKKILVKETVEEVVEKTVAYKQQIHLQVKE
jgi:flagellar protein FlbD